MFTSLRPLRLNRKAFIQLTYALPLAASMILTFGRLIILAKFLEVEQFYLFSTGLVASSMFGALGCLGIFFDFQRRLPMQLARGAIGEAAVALFQCVIAAMILGATALVLAPIGAIVAKIPITAIVFGVLHGFAQQLFLIVTTESRSNTEFLRYARQHLVRSIAITVIGAGVAAAFNSAVAVLAAECFVTTFLSFIIFRAMKLRNRMPTCFAFKAGFATLSNLHWTSVMSLLGYSLVVSVSTQIDRWIAVKYLEPSEFAYYSLAWIVMFAAYAAQALVNAAMYPIVARRYATAGTTSALRLTLIASFGSLVLAAVCAGPCLLAADVLIPRYLPNYEPALHLLPMLALAASLRLSDFWSSYLIISGQERQTLIVTLASISIALLIWFCYFEQPSPLHFTYLATLMAVCSYIGNFSLCLRAQKSRN